MYQVLVCFKILEEGKYSPPGCTKSTVCLIFDIKMDFTRKARWAKDFHRTPYPENSSDNGVVSHEIVWIALTTAAFQGVDLLAADIRNAYLQAPSLEKHFIICRHEFGLEHQWKLSMIVQALYGRKVAGQDLWHQLRSCMKHLGF